MIRKSIGRQGFGGGYPVGVGYATIPTDVSRDKFIKDCYGTSSIMVRGEYGDMFRRVSVDKTLLQEIVFPENSGELGSGLIWIRIPKHNIPVIIAILDKKGERNSVFEENQFRTTRNSKSGTIDFSGKTSIQQISLSVVSKLAGKGSIVLRVINPDETGLIDLMVKGVVNLLATKQIDFNSYNKLDLTVVDNNLKKIGGFSYLKGSGWVVFDEFGNKFSSSNNGVEIKDLNGNIINSNSLGIDLIPKSGTTVNVGGKVEPIPLGTTLNNNITSLINELNKLNTALAKYSAQQSIVTASGPLAPLSVGYAGLTADVSPIILNLNNLLLSLPNNLSKKSMLE